MKNNGLLKKLGIIGLAGGLIASSLTGCGNLKAEDVLAWDLFMAGQNKNLTQKDRENLAYMQRLAQEQAQRQHDLDVANAGKNEINIYNQNEVNKEANRYFFTCNYWKDFNGNEMVDYPNEFIGIKNRFSKNEGIAFVLIDSNPGEIGGHQAGMQIYNPKGNIILFRNVVLPYAPNNGNTMITENGQNPIPVKTLIQNSGYGNYKAVWTLDGRYFGATDFEIVDDN